MRIAHLLVAASLATAIAGLPASPASGADQLTWPQVQAATKAAETIVTRDGGTVTLDVSAKISFTLVTAYRPGGNVTRASYREAGMADSEPDKVTWTITKGGVQSAYEPMPPLPKSGAYPTLRRASWVRLNPETADTSTSIAQLLIWDPMGAISSGPGKDAGLIEASWTHGINGSPASDVTATFAQRPTGLVLQSFTVKELNTAGPASTQSVQVDFTAPKLTVPSFSSALPESYVKAATNAALNTTAAYYTIRNSAITAREKAATMTRAELIDFVRSQVAANQDFSHPPDNPSTDSVTHMAGGLRLTNHNAYSGQSTVWTISVAPDKRVVVTKRTRPSKVTQP